MLIILIIILVIILIIIMIMLIIILIMVPPDTELYSSGGMAVAGWLEGPTGRVEQVSIMDMTIMMITIR